MKKMIQDLINLHHIDLRLVEIEKSMGNLPAILNNKLTKLDGINEIINNKKQGLEDAESGKKSVMIHIDDFNAKLSKYKDQLFKVKNNKEYDAISSEIAFVDDKINSSNDILSGHEKKILDYEEDIKSVEQDHLALQKEVDEIKITIDTLNKENKTEQTKLEKSRETAKKKIDDKHLNMYEISRAMNKGVGMAELDIDACSNCYTVVPQNLLLETKSRAQFNKCPGCSIYLYFEIEEN